MRRKPIHDLAGSSHRGGFTLVEMAVAIFIIVTLIALSAGAVLKFMVVQQRTNTQSTLDRTQAKLNKAWSAVKDEANRSPMTEPAYIPGTIPPQPAGMTVAQWIQQNLAGNDANAAARTRVIYIKLFLRRAFPMNFNEALYPAPLPQLPAYVNYLQNLGVTGTLNANYESSACLLMALQRYQSGSGVDVSDLISGGAAGTADSPTGGSIPYLTDAWNQPVYFSRFPTGSILLNPNGALAGNNDPGDPQGLLNSGTWGYSGNTNCRSIYSALTLQQLATGTTPPAPSLSYKLAPMLMSMGPDRTPGSDPITFAPLSGKNQDDLFSTP